MALTTELLESMVMMQEWLGRMRKAEPVQEKAIAMLKMLKMSVVAYPI